MGELTAQVRISECFQPQNLVRKRASLWHDSMPQTRSLLYQVLRLEDSDTLP